MTKRGSTPTEFSRRVVVTPAFHRVHADPRQDYGVGSADLVFVLRGPLGAISWEVFTSWMLPETWEWWAKRRDTPGDSMFGQPMPDSVPKSGLVTLHAAATSREHENRRLHDTCDWVDGPCWSEILSCGWGDALLTTLIAEGDGPVWPRLREFYDRYLAEIPDRASAI